jgi:uncharacterized metal-binding protein YceD (DUF177 family)
MTPELSRIFPLTRLGNGTDFTVTATPAECDAVAARLLLPSILSLQCRFDLTPGESGSVLARGTLHARIVQSCVISLDMFETAVTEEFSARFVPAGTETEEIDIEQDDEIPYEGNSLDLGEATTEQLALALDPFPKKPGAEPPAPLEDEPTGPMAALAKLRRPG